MHILPNISRSKDNHVMKYGQLIEYNVRSIFLQNHTENKAGRLVLYNKNGSRTVAPEENWKLPPRIIASEENCCRKIAPTIKLPPKIIAANQVNFPKTVQRVI